RSSDLARPRMDVRIASSTAPLHRHRSFTMRKLILPALIAALFAVPALAQDAQTQSTTTTTTQAPEPVVSNDVKQQSSTTTSTTDPVTGAVTTRTDATTGAQSAA